MTQPPRLGGLNSSGGGSETPRAPKELKRSYGDGHD